MSFIQLTTFIAAPQERVFDLGRSVDLYKASMRSFDQKAVGGKLQGLMKLNDTTHWQARHLFRERKLQVKITAMQEPYSFIEEQVSGGFATLKHEHYFKPVENGTIMIDQFYFTLPYGTAGRLFTRFYLSGYLKSCWSKGIASSKKWQSRQNGKPI